MKHMITILDVRFIMTCNNLSSEPAVSSMHTGIYMLNISLSLYCLSTSSTTLLQTSMLHVPLLHVSGVAGVAEPWGGDGTSKRRRWRRGAEAVVGCML